MTGHAYFRSHKMAKKKGAFKGIYDKDDKHDNIHYMNDVISLHKSNSEIAFKDAR
jgi:hypothetical protein